MGPCNAKASTPNVKYEFDIEVTICKIFPTMPNRAIPINLKFMWYTDTQIGKAIPDSYQYINIPNFSTYSDSISETKVLEQQKTLNLEFPEGMDVDKLKKRKVIFIAEMAYEGQETIILKKDLGFSKIIGLNPEKKENDFEIVENYKSGKQFKSINVQVWNKSYLSSAKVERSDGYDIVIDVNDLLDGMKEGWQVKRSEDVLKKLEEPISYKALLGNFNQGKTFLANIINDAFLEAGAHQHTKGLSFIFNKTNGKLGNSANVDTPGTFEPLPKSIIKLNRNEKKDKIMWKQLNELFLKEIIIENVSLLVQVVSRLTIYEQNNINYLAKNYPDKLIIVAHNFYHLESEEDIKNAIHNNILLAFDVIPLKYGYDTLRLKKEKSEYYLNYFVDKNKKLFHVVLAHNKLDFAWKYNEPSIRFIKYTIVNERKIDFLNIVSKKANDFLFNYLQTNNNKPPNFLYKKKDNLEGRIFCSEKISNPRLKELSRRIDGTWDVRENLQHCEYRVSSILTPNEDNTATLELEFTILLLGDSSEYEYLKLEVCKDNNRKKVTCNLKLKRKKNPHKKDDKNCPIIIDTHSNIPFQERNIPIIIEKPYQMILRTENKTEEKLEIKRVSRKRISFFVPKFDPNSNYDQMGSIPDEKKHKLGESNVIDPSLIPVKAEVTEGFDLSLILNLPIHDQIRNDPGKIVPNNEHLISFRRKDVEKFELEGQRIISITGGWGEGKTFFIEKLCKVGPKTLKSGLSKNDDGFHVKYLDQKNSLFMEISSGGRPLLKNSRIDLWENEQKEMKLLKRKVHEDFIQNFAYNTSHLLIFVLTQLTFMDQEMIYSLAEYKNITKMIVLHNYKDILDEKHIHSKIESQLKESFDVRPCKFPELANEDGKNMLEKVNKLFFEETFQNSHGNTVVIRHLIFAKEGSPAGNVFNEIGIWFLDYLIHMELEIVGTQIKIEDSFKKFVIEKFPYYYEATNNPLEWEYKGQGDVGGYPSLKSYEKTVYKLNAERFKPLVFGLSLSGIQALNLYEPLYMLKKIPNKVADNTENGLLEIRLDIVGPKYLYSNLDLRKLTVNPKLLDEDMLEAKSEAEFANQYFKPGQKVWSFDYKIDYNDERILKIQISGQRQNFLGNTALNDVGPNQIIGEDKNNIKLGLIKLEIEIEREDRNGKFWRFGQPKPEKQMWEGNFFCFFLDYSLE